MPEDITVEQGQVTPNAELQIHAAHKKAQLAVLKAIPLVEPRDALMLAEAYRALAGGLVRA